MVATNSSAEAKADLPGARGGWAYWRPLTSSAAADAVAAGGGRRGVHFLHGAGERPGGLPVVAGQGLALLFRLRYARHDAGHHAVGKLARQCQATGIEQPGVVAALLGLRQGLAAGIHSGGRRPAGGAVELRISAGDLGERVCRARVPAAVHLRQLSREHVRQADAAALGGQADGQLLVVHFLVLLGGRGVHEVAFGEHVVGRAHRLEHFIHEQRFEFLGHLADVALAVATGAVLQLRQAIEVGVGPGIGPGRASGKQFGIHVGVLRSRSGRLAARRPVSGLRESPSGRWARRPPG